MRLRRLAVATIVSGACATALAAPPARAINLLKPVCAIGGLVSGLVGKGCEAVQHSGQLVSAGKKLLTGHVGSAVKTLAGSGSSVASKATFAVGLAAVVTWVVGGARYAINATATVIGHTTAPQLRSTWFSATYWRVAGIAAVLTLPFLFAAAIQALIRSDLTLLARAAFGFLPLATLAVGIAAPLTMLLLAATDQLSAIVSSAAGHASTHFLTWAGTRVGALVVLSRSPFLVFFVGLLTVGAAIVLWFELLLRAAAVYVIVLMLPVAFAAFVWPARRIWAIRAVEVLIALILSKFLIVAVLSLGGAALSQSSLTSISGMLAGFVLLTLGALTPWALLRLLPLGEIASAAVGSLRSEPLRVGSRLLQRSDAGGSLAHDWGRTTAEMRREADGFVDDDALDGRRSSASQPEPRAAEDLVGDAVPVPGNGGPPQPGPGGSDAAERVAAGLSGIDVPRSGTDTSETASDAPPDTGNGLAPGAADRPAPPRHPGMEPIWQMEDETWPTLKLGLEHGWPPKPIAGTARTDAEPPSGPDGAGHDRDTPAPEREDHDPRPAPQPPEDGSL